MAASVKITACCGVKINRIQKATEGAAAKQKCTDIKLWGHTFGSLPAAAVKI
jgi:hypothetical protein